MLQCLPPIILTIVSPLIHLYKAVNGGMMGWIVGPDSELIFWVPLSHQLGLWWPENVAVMSSNVTKLDFNQFRQGRPWQQCRKSFWYRHSFHLIFHSLIPIWIWCSAWEWAWSFWKRCTESHHNVWCISFQAPPIESHQSHHGLHVHRVNALSRVFFVCSLFCWCFPSIASLLIVLNGFGVLWWSASASTIQVLQDPREGSCRSCTEKWV